MKKILLTVLGVIVAAGLITVMVVKQQAGYTKVFTARLVRQDLSSTVNGTGQIKPQTYVNVGAQVMGRITHLYVKEGDRVRKGETVAEVENIQQEAAVSGQQAAIVAAQTNIASFVAAEKTAEANLEHAKADLEDKRLDWIRAQALYKAGIMAKQDYDAKKAAYDLDVASVAQAVAGVNQAHAQTEQARAQYQTQVADLRSDQDMLDRTIAVAPFDGVVTYEPVRQGDTVVPGIQNTEGSTLMTLADMSVVTAEVKVDEDDIINVALGQPATITVDAMPNRTFKGRVTLVGDQALLRSTGAATSESTTGTEEAKDFKVVITLDHPSDELRPGLSCEAKIVTAHKDDVLALPIQALTLYNPALDSSKNKGAVQAATVSSTGTQPIQGVFVAEKDSHGRLRAKFVPVKTGITGATNIEVLSGLKAGEEVVTGPYRTLRDLKDGALLKRDTAAQFTLGTTGGS